MKPCSLRLDLCELFLCVSLLFCLFVCCFQIIKILRVDPGTGCAAKVSIAMIELFVWRETGKLLYISIDFYCLSIRQGQNLHVL
jgi:hypothetical protein